MTSGSPKVGKGLRGPRTDKSDGLSPDYVSPRPGLSQLWPTSGTISRSAVSWSDWGCRDTWLPSAFTIRSHTAVLVATGTLSQRWNAACPRLERARPGKDRLAEPTQKETRLWKLSSPLSFLSRLP